MPGKSQQSGRGKQDSSKDRLSPASQSESARKITIWPEWTEAELAAEKWDLGGGKGRAKSSAVFEDTEGTLLPPSLLASGKVVWKRPSDTALLTSLGDEAPVIVLNPDSADLDLVSSNSHLMHSEFTCWMLSQLNALWQNRHILAVDAPDIDAGGEGVAAMTWRPWEHIHPHPKGTPAPQVNPSGKYCVRLYWMGCWRKVTVDDLLPFIEESPLNATAASTDANGATEELKYTPLYPRTAHHVELWPAILTKAILKITALDYSGSSELSELGDCSLVHMLTGWTPLVLPIKTKSFDEVWRSLVDVLPKWTRDDPCATEDQRKQKKCLVLAGFTSVMNRSQARFLSSSQIETISSSEAALKQDGLLPFDYSLHSHPSYPMLISQVRAEPLVLPPAEPPLPMLQAPFYLGLKHRARAPGEPTPPPTPSPVEPRFVEVVSPFFTYKNEKVEWNHSSSFGETDSNKGSANEEMSQPDGASERDGDNNTEVDDKNVWMEYLDFVKGFQTLYIFNCSTNFEHKESYADLSQTVEGTVQVATSAHLSKKATSASQLASASKVGSTSAKPQNLLFVDSPDPVTLHIVLASLSNWREGQRNTHTASQRNPVGVFPHPPTPVSTSGNTGVDPQDNGTVSSHTQQAPEREYVITGSLIVETYSWQSVQSGKYVLRLTSTGTKGTVLSLPPGRHVFKLHVRAPIGHHLEISSHTPFVLTDQDGIFAHLNKESSLYLSYGANLVKTLLSIASSLGSADQSQEESLHPLLEFYSDFALTKEVFTLVLASVLQAWAKQATQYGLSDKMQFAWKAFLYKAFTFLKQQSPNVPRDSSTVETTLSISELRRQLQASIGELEEKNSTVPESWTNREATVEEENAAKVIQRSLSHHLNHCREQRMKQGTSIHQQALEKLQASIPLIEPSVVELGILTLRGLFRLRPSLLEKFPFCHDEKTRAFSKVYSGPFPPLLPNSWTIIFREVFHVKESQCLVPHFECPVSSHLFRVIDNDTNSEMPRLFHSTPPHVYRSNHRGYTFQAEAWNSTSDGILSEDGRWSLRIVSSSPSLPVLDGGETTGEVATMFYTKEVIDYCLPDRNGCLFRYFLTVSQDCPISVQLCTSKPNAFCKLEILDEDVSKAETRGRGNCTIPLYLLEANQETEPKEEDATCAAKTHKYLVRATILRDSWPLSESAWPYISMIKSMEKLEERSGSKPGSAKKAKREKGGGGKKGGATPQQSSSQLNQTDKPHWTLRIVTRSNDKEVLEVKKDTERADNLKGMVQAWEVEQPGRTKKAQESRQKFLDSHAIKENVGPGTEEDHSTAAVSVISEGSTVVPHPNTGPVKIVQMDLSPYIVKGEGQAKLFDESEEKARLQERQKLFKDYRNKRQAVVQIRNADREQRNEAKVKQLEQAEEWQDNLDKLRNKLNAGREAIREKHLAKERARQEAELAAIKAQEELQAAAGRDSKMAKGAKGKGKKK